MSLSKMYALVIVFSCRRTFLYLNFLHYVFFHYVNLGSQWGFLGSTVDKNLPANAGDTEMWVRALASGRPPGEGNSNPFQYSCLENPMDTGTCGLQSIELQRVGHRLSD